MINVGCSPNLIHDKTISLMTLRCHTFGGDPEERMREIDEYNFETGYKSVRRLFWS